MDSSLFSNDSMNEDRISTKKKESANKKEVKKENKKPLNINDIKEACLKYFNGDSLAADVWINKYALREGESIYELTPDDMHRRLAKEFNRIENKYKNPMSEEEIYELLKDFKYIIPQGSPMFGIGNNYQIVSLSNCFVIGNNGNSDSYGGILKIDEEQVQLMKRRGGVGHDLSHIRPKELSGKELCSYFNRYCTFYGEIF
jgi:ribonucleoside-diphosphate reductase alpha chain